MMHFHITLMIAGLAQLVEHRPCKSGVTRSNRVSSTILQVIIGLAVAEWLMLLIVSQVYAGSNPVGHPYDDFSAGSSVG